MLNDVADRVTTVVFADYLNTLGIHTAGQLANMPVQ